MKYYAVVVTDTVLKDGVETVYKYTPTSRRLGLSVQDNIDNTVRSILYFRMADRKCAAGVDAPNIKKSDADYINIGGHFDQKYIVSRVFSISELRYKRNIPFEESEF